MTEPILYAKAGSTPSNWDLLGVKLNGIEVMWVYEANVTEGWILVTAQDEQGRPVREGESFKMVKLEGEVEIFVKPVVN